MRIKVVGGDEPRELAALHSWLRDDRELQGCVKQVSRSPGPQELGGVLEAITAALGSTAAAMALAERLAAWIRSRRSAVKFTITTDDGRTLEVEAKDSADASSMIIELLRREGDAGA
ncbi:effector-associated constant component EACC1 [Actinoallomurus sp. CA-150999]|uniref:effector-associated constant component EACC1 n=1 Tax=Actinoallomurus sp. CA-150999 TaxID=3239887 RepID=UPI003D8C5468